MAIEFKHATLANGLTIVGEIDPSAHTAALGFFVKTGARDEATPLMGVSHFLEHMMFKGTAKRSAAEVDQEFDDIGADHNAFTTSEMTAFHAHTLPEHLDRATEILADIMRPALRQEDFDSEKSVILEEIAMYADVPFWVLYERAMEEYYGEHPLSHRVLGTTDSITRLTRDEMMAYFTTRYSADNTVVAVSGHANFDEVLKRIDADCGSWNTTRPTRVLSQPRRTERVFTQQSEMVHRHYMLMQSPGPALNDDRRYAASMLAHILGDSDGSRLYWALIEPGIADEAQSQYEGRDGLGEVLVYASCSPEAATEVEAIIRREIGGLADSLTEQDMQRVRSKAATGVTLHGELPAGRMKRLGQQWIYRREYRSLEDELRRINAVTIDDLRAVCAAFPLTPVVVGHLTPA